MRRLKLWCQALQFPLELTVFVGALLPHEFFENKSRLMIHDHIETDIHKRSVFILGHPDSVFDYSSLVGT
jgi:hypothetical protein